MNVGSNRADSVANDTEKALKGFEGKIDKDEAENIKEEITALRDSSITAQQLKEPTDANRLVDSVQQDSPCASRAAGTAGGRRWWEEGVTVNSKEWAIGRMA
jgi:hypothetical protein